MWTYSLRDHDNSPIVATYKIIPKFESNKMKFHKSLYAETGKLGVADIWVYKTGP